MPHFPEFFLAVPDYSFANYLSFIKSKGEDLCQTNLDLYIQWYKIDSRWSRLQNDVTRAQLNSIGNASAGLKNLTHSDMKAILDSVKGTETSTINKYVNNNNNFDRCTFNSSVFFQPQTQPPPEEQQTPQPQLPLPAEEQQQQQHLPQQERQRTKRKRTSTSMEGPAMESHQQQQQDINGDVVELLDPTAFEYQRPAFEDRYYVNDFDVSQSFYDFQMSLMNHQQKFHMETHLHHILAASSILLIKPGRMPEDIVNIFGEENMDLFMQDIQDRMGITTMMNARRPIDLITKLTVIVEDVRTRAKSRNQGICALLSMKDEVTKNEFKIIKSVVNLIGKLPKKLIIEEVKEHELCSRYLDPVLCGLFDNPDEDIFFRWTGQSNLESRNSPLISERRPDSCLTKLSGAKWKNTFGIGEVECGSEIDNTYAICKDLLRLGVFSKNAVDFGMMRGVLAYQAIGRSITFYMTTLLKDGLYTMVELTRVTVPGCLDDVPGYLMEINKLSLVLKVFDNWCYCLNPSEVEKQKKRLRSTLSTPEFCRIISSSTSRSRDSVMKSYLN